MKKEQRFSNKFTTTKAISKKGQQLLRILRQKLVLISGQLVKVVALVVADKQIRQQGIRWNFEMLRIPKSHQFDVR